MEELFAHLGIPARLWVIQYLVAHGPTKQADLARAFARTDLSGSSEPNPGAMSQTVRPLIQHGLIGRTGRRKRDPLVLRYEAQTRQLLSTASALTVAITSDAHASASQSHGELMRDLTVPIARESDDAHDQGTAAS